MVNMFLKPYLELCKINLSFFSALSAATGFILASSDITGALTFTVAGVFLLACGSCSLNQYQERNTDALMKRTGNRPMPSGRIKPVNALYFSFFLLIAGSSLLGLSGSIPAFILGVCAVLLYNGVYTYLKRKTVFASVPCALIGALPPAIGWFAGNGRFPDHRIMAVCLLFFIWQITHFWLLFLSHGDDYEKAGFPSLSRLFAIDQIVRIVFIWILATGAAFLLMPLYGLMTSRTAALLLIPATIWLVVNGIKILRKRADASSYYFAFRKMNVYILLVMLLLNADRLFNR
jgi:protoheme IX farnesyltransferase